MAEIDETRAALAPLAAALTEGQAVAIHCRMGIGRSSLIAVSLLTRVGHAADDAWRRVEAARGRPVPDTPEQRAWVEVFARGSPRWREGPSHEWAGALRSARAGRTTGALRLTN